MKTTISTCPVTGRRIALRTITPLEHETALLPRCADGTQAAPYIPVSPSINYDTSWTHSNLQPHTHAAIHAPVVRDTFFEPLPKPRPFKFRLRKFRLEKKSRSKHNKVTQFN